MIQVAPNTVVKLAYQLRNEPNGEIVDEATADSPFPFLFGHQNVLPKFEDNLRGKFTGSTFEFVLSPEDGYGVYDETAVIQLAKEMFSVDGVVQEDLMTIGTILPLQDDRGNPFQGRVVAVENEAVTVDLNHPLAGKELHFSGTILDIRDAHPIELEHGHVHENGNHHH